MVVVVVGVGVVAVRSDRSFVGAGAVAEGAAINE